MTDSLRTRIAAVIEAQHVSEFQGGIHPEDVLRLADAVTDLLIDMAGQGELLKAMDRMYR